MKNVDQLRSQAAGSPIVELCEELQFPYFNHLLRARAGSSLEASLNDMLDLLVQENDKTSTGRKRRFDGLPKLREMLSMILLNLMCIHLLNPKGERGELRVPTSGRVCATGKLGPLFSHQRRPSLAVEMMIRSEFVSRRAHSVKGTLLTPRHRLIKLIETKVSAATLCTEVDTHQQEHLESVVLVKEPKDNLKAYFHKNPAPLPCPTELATLESGMAEINKALAVRPIHYQTEWGIEPMNHYLLMKARVPKDLSSTGRRRLTRIYNNGSLSYGGRMYRAFWVTMNAEERQRIILDGEECSYIDFNAMGLRLALALAGRPSKSPEDLYQRALGMDSRFTRKGLKLLLTAALSSFKRLTHWPNGALDHFPSGTKLKDMLEVIQKAYPELEGQWFRGLGSELQRIDSDIMVDIVVESLGRDITVLPIHDGLLCPKGKAKEIEALMVEVFAKHTNGTLGVVTREW